MEKLDKVIAGLEHCRDKSCGCDGCPYYDDTDCENQVVWDAVELLKAQAEKLDILRAELAEERERSARWLRESEPVVHAHWVKLTPDQKLSPFSDRTHSCSKCGKHGCKWYDRCWSCGAIMDEKVFEPTPLIRLDLGGRINKRLKQMGVRTVEELEAMDKHTLHNIPGLGRRSIETIESELRIWKEMKEKNNG